MSKIIIEDFAKTKDDLITMIQSAQLKDKVIKKIIVIEMTGEDIELEKIRIAELREQNKVEPVEVINKKAIKYTKYNNQVVKLEGFKKTIKK